MINLKSVVLNALEEIKAENINTIAVDKLTTITDAIIIATGTSTTHVKAIANKVIKAMKDNAIIPFGIEGERQAEWILIDLGDIIVHVMLSNVRNYYNLEKFWTPIVEEEEELLAVNC